MWPRLRRRSEWKLGDQDLDQREPVRGLQVDDVAAFRHRLGFCDREHARLDVFVFVGLVRRVRTGSPKIRYTEVDQLLVTKARCGKKSSNAVDSAGDERNFLFAFSSGCRLRRLPFIEAACRKFPGLAPDAVTILANEDDMLVIMHRQQHDGWSMADGFDSILAALGSGNCFHI